MLKNSVIDFQRKKLNLKYCGAILIVLILGLFITFRFTKSVEYKLPYVYIYSENTNYLAYRIINNACFQAGITARIGTHTLRKTFGYHFYNKTKDVALLQCIFNHSAPSVTLAYIGINQDIIDSNLHAFAL